MFIDCFRAKGLKIVKKRALEQFEDTCKCVATYNVSSSTVAITKILNMQTKTNKMSDEKDKDKGKDKDKNIFVFIDAPKQICDFNKAHAKHYDILKNVNHDCFKYITPLNGKIDSITYDISKGMYLNNWLYYASSSPFWQYKIEYFGGSIDHQNKTVSFDNDCEEDMYEFYDLYGLEPDEQPIIYTNYRFKVTDRCICWNAFYDKYKEQGRGIFKPYEEELEELTS